MQNRIKRIFAMLLCLGMLIALLPTFAAAEDAEPDESTIELPEVEDAEPEEEESTEEPASDEQAKAANAVVVLEEELEPGTNYFEAEAYDTIYYRPLRTTESRYYSFSVSWAGTLYAHFADSELNELSTGGTSSIFEFLQAGETYYFGVSCPHGNQGTVKTTLTVYPENACGNDLIWNFDANTGTLSFVGSGSFWAFEQDAMPWAVYKDQIRTVDFRNADVKRIIAYAFYNYENLTSALFKTEDFPWVEEYAFYGTGIREVNLHWGVQPYSFANCKNLETVTITDSFCSTIDEHAFENSSLKTIELTYTTNVNSAIDIEAYAFANCTELETADFGGCLRSVGAHAFENSGIITITPSSKLSSIGAYAYANCPNLVTAQLPVKPNTSPARPGVVPEGAFKNSGIQSLYIPKNVAEIGKDALYGCTKLLPDAFTVDPENAYFTAKDGMLFEKDGTTLLFAIPSLTSCTVPFGVQTIPANAFYHMPLLTEVSVLPGMKTIETNAFVDCPALESVTIQTSVSAIRAAAFTDCPAITDVYYLGTEANRNANLTIDAEGNDALLNATWHYQEPCSFDGSVKWNTNDVQFKGTTPYMICTGNPLTPGFTLKTADGETVDPATYTVEYRENVNAGTAYIFVTFTEGYTGTMRLFFKIYLPATTEMSIWNIKDGIKLSWKPVPGADGYVIYRRAWNQQSAGWTTFERWNNTTGTTWTDKTVYAGTRYQYGVKAYFNRRMDRVTGAMLGGNVGDNYNLGMVGPLKTTVRITTRHLSMLKAGSSRITATWEPSKVFTGYELRYSTDETFTNDLKTVSITDPTTSSITLKSLKNGKYYYVSIRSYHEFEGMTYYGQWSNVIRIKPGSSTTVYDVMYRALTIGENTYKQSPLKGCVNDMKAMSGMLKKLNRPFTVKTLQNADKATIIKGISTAFAEAWDNDVSVFHYSGHGVDARGSSDYEQMQGALVSVDMQYITFKELAEELSKVKGRVIVILDSCHSGASIAKSDKENQEELEAFNQAAIDAFSGYYLETNGEEGGSNTRMGELKQSKFIVITAASSGQSSYDGKFDGSGYHQGAFTAAIIKGLGCKYPDGKYTGSMPADKNGDNKITLKELYDYAFLQANEWVYQNAQYYGPDGEVLFRR